MDTVEVVDARYYQVARPGSLAERVAIRARDRIYADFLRLTSPTPASTILDVGVSDVVGEAANVLERKYPHIAQITAVGLGAAAAFQQAFPRIRYRQIQPGEALPFGDKAFDIACSNAVLEHVGSRAAQRQFVAELVRVARIAFISVPHKFFPVEHHTGIPILHWTGPTFRLSAALLGKAEWTRAETLILMTRAHLRQVCPPDAPVEIGYTGIRLGPCGSNLYALIRG